ncbi:MAG TPA: ATP-dependent DNA helicase [Desulfuromonadales bacterium]|nr:ATP-dependent DNA helicase [Desulfuromonadales bacterium]
MTTTDISELIRAGKSDTLELKSTFDREAIESLTAFANTTGGILLVGVQDSGGVTGVTVGKETVQNWINQIKMATTPAIIPDVEIVSLDEKSIVVFFVAAFPIKPVACKGKYFRRSHAANHLMSLNQVSDAYLKTFQLSWDSYQYPDAQFKDIDTRKLSLFIEKVNRVERFHLDDDYRCALEKLRLIEGTVPTNAAMLLFSANPLPYNIHIGRFSDFVTIRDDAQISDTLSDAFSRTMQAIAKHINISFKIKGMEREEIWEYPQVAVREALANAIVHRDYQNPSDIQIKIFDNRLTIYSPGRLYGNLTIEALRQDSYHSELRNKLVAEAFYLTGLIEKYGSGITRIRKAVAEAGNIDFVMEELPNGVLVTFNKRAEEINGGITGGITGGINEVLDYVNMHPGVKGGEISGRFGFSQRTLERLLKELKEGRKIIFKGSKKTGGYYAVESSEALE